MPISTFSSSRLIHLLSCMACLILLFSFFPNFPAAQESANNAFVRVSERDPRYFELSDGTPYIPNGFCLVPSPQENEIESVLSTMASHRINFCRIWLDQTPWNVEYQKSGEYDEAKAKVLDRFLSLAQAHGIRVKMCIEHFRDIPAQKQKWSDKPLHHQANGGPFDSMEDFLNSEEGMAQFHRKLEFYQNRYADHPAVFAWELWNEVDTVRGDSMKWTKAMLPVLQRLFPRNLAVQSLGSYDSVKKRGMYRTVCELAENDVAQVHRYLDLGASWDACHGPTDLLAADAVRELRAFNLNKPILLAETGAVKPNHTGCSDLYAKDKEGMMLHDGIFAPFFAGAAGSGHTWWWRQSIESPNHWHHYARFAEALAGIDPPAEKFEPVLIDHSRLRVYALLGRNTLLAWCKDSQNDWRTELEQGQPPELLINQSLDLNPHLAGRTVDSVRVYDPWQNSWTEVEIKEGTLLFPPFKRSTVVKLSYRD